MEVTDGQPASNPPEGLSTQSSFFGALVFLGVIGLIVWTIASLETAFVEQRLRKQYQSVVARDLSDPESARFRDVVVYHQGTGFLAWPSDSDRYFACEEVNAKNTYGGYEGYRRFYATESFGLIEPSEELSREARQVGVGDPHDDWTKAHAVYCTRSKAILQP